MGTKGDLPSVDHTLAAIADRQYGVLTRDQLFRSGLSAHGIHERVRTKRLLRLHRGVYAPGHKRLRRNGYLLAAVLACGEEAVASHGSAAELWNIRGNASSVVDVTVPSQNGRVRRKGIRTHRSGRLGPADVTIKDGIPVTTVARTLLDLADVLNHQALKRAIDESEYQRLFDLTALTAVVNANPGRRGTKVLRLAKDPPHLTRSEMENRFLRICARHNIPAPHTNQTMLGYEVDAFWPHANLVVELDGYAAHGTRKAFQADRERDRRLVSAGFRPVRVTPLDLRNEPALARELRALLRS